MTADARRTARHRLLIGTAEGVQNLNGDAALSGRRVGPFASGSGIVGLVDGQTVVRRDDKGWHDVAALTEPCRCVAVVGDDVLVGTAGPHLERVHAGSVERVRSFDDAPTRDEWYTPWGGPADTRSMTVSPDGTLLVNVHVGGVLRSPDMGSTWQPTIDLHADVHEVHAHPTAPGLVLAAAAVGLCRSDDDGRTWDVFDDGLHATYLRAIAIAGDTVLVSASTGPAGSRSAIYRAPLHSTGRRFERCRAGLPEWLAGNIDTFCLVADPDGSFVAFGDHEGAVFVSEDAGRSWDTARSGLAPVVALALAPA